MNDWQPIETAIEDTAAPIRLRGKYPRGWAEVEIEGKYDTGSYTEGWVDARGNEFWPTHWQPLRR